MNCPEVKKIIPVFLEGDLAPDTMQQVGDHLKICEACRKEAVKYHKSWELLSLWGEIEPQPGYVSRFWTRVSQEVAWQEKLKEGIGAFLKGARLTPVLAGVCVFMIVGVAVFRTYIPYKNAEQVLSKMSSEEIEFVENVDLARHFDVIEDIDVIEDLDLIEKMDKLPT